jgi:putative DNA methylase
MIGHDPKSGPRPDRDGTINRTGATCIACGAAVSLAHVRAEGLVGKLGSQLMATVAMGKQSRVYLPPSDDQITASLVDRPQYPQQVKYLRRLSGFV